MARLLVKLSTEQIDLLRDSLKSYIKAKDTDIDDIELAIKIRKCLKNELDDSGEDCGDC